VLALARYVAICGEFEPDAAVEVVVNGQTVRRVKFTRESLLEGPTTIPLDAGSLQSGANRIELHRVSGATPVYAVALASSWAASDVVKPAGHLVAVERGFVREKAQATLMGTLKITPEPMPDGGPAVAGEQVSAEVTLCVTNELEYVMVEVPKPAGCEPLNPLSGWDAQLTKVETGTSPDLKEDDNGRGKRESGRAIYREEHDDKSVFFLAHIEPGTWKIRFGLRATTPGDFRALPVEATAMYVPEVRANSDARRVRIEARSLGVTTPAR